MRTSRILRWFERKPSNFFGSATSSNRRAAAPLSGRRRQCPTIPRRPHLAATAAGCFPTIRTTTGAREVRPGAR